MLLVGFPVHEFCHALAAYRLGDSTARWQGRLTLDPRVHFDPVGGMMLVISALFSQGGFFFGYAKPTPVNPMNLHGGRRGEAWVAAAGPLSNLVMAAIVAIPLRGLVSLQRLLRQSSTSPARGADLNVAYYFVSSTCSCSSSTCCQCRRSTAGRSSAASCHPRRRGRCATLSSSTPRSSRSSSWRSSCSAAARSSDPSPTSSWVVLLGPQYGVFPVIR